MRGSEVQVLPAAPKGPGWVWRTSLRSQLRRFGLTRTGDGLLPPSWVLVLFDGWPFEQILRSPSLDPHLQRLSLPTWNTSRLVEGNSYAHLASTLPSQ